MMQVALGSEPWWVGFAFIGMDVAAFAFIEGVWLYAQREVAFVDGRIVVRRWLEVLFGAPGTSISLDSRTRSVVTIEHGRRLEIERDGVAVVSMQLAYWEKDALVELVNQFRLRGAALTAGKGVTDGS
jgi:hypothetical protein